MQVSSNQTVILGAPGCGKTTSLLTAVESCFSEGILPNEVAFVSFTKKAATEAIDRACARFGFNKKDLPYFKTLHSLAFQQLALRSSQVLGFEDYKILGKALGVTFTHSGVDIVDVSGSTGDVMSFIEAISRARMESLEETYHALGGFNLEWRLLDRYKRSYDAYKRDTAKLDFTDMLTMFVEQKKSVPVRVAFIDEAQDLSLLQWEACKVAFADCERVFIAGDDDQAIYHWAGADVKSFLNLTGTKVVLNKSHRLPRKIHAFVQGISSSITDRYEKIFSSSSDEGEISTHRDVFHVPCETGQWMFLARNTHSLEPVEDMLKARGFAYKSKRGSSVKPAHVSAILTWESLRKGNIHVVSEVKACFDHIILRTQAQKEGFEWLEKQNDRMPISMEDLREKFNSAFDKIWHDALTNISINTREYYLSILRNGEKLTDEPRITVSTIHAAKGGEADNVVILADMAQKTYAEYQKTPDNEHRVFYVGASRAKRHLHLIAPQTSRYYNFPLLA